MIDAGQIGTMPILLPIEPTLVYVSIQIGIGFALGVGLAVTGVLALHSALAAAFRVGVRLLTRWWKWVRFGREPRSQPIVIISGLTIRG